MNTLFESWKIVRALRAYYHQLVTEPLTEREFTLIIGRMPLSMRHYYLGWGLARSLRRVSFQHHCLEWRGCGRDEFMARRLSAGTLARWRRSHEVFDELLA